MFVVSGAEGDLDDVCQGLHRQMKPLTVSL